MSIPSGFTLYSQHKFSIDSDSDAKIELDAVVGYTILHAPTPGGPYAQAGTVAATENSFAHAGFFPNAPNYYMVRATDIEGQGTAISTIAEAFIAPATRLMLAGRSLPFDALSRSLRSVSILGLYERSFRFPRGRISNNEY